MKVSKNVYIAIVVAMTLAYLIAFSQAAFGQQVVQQGKVFVEQKSDRESGETKTEYLYQDKTGAIDTVYLSSKGKAFIWKTSKKSGKRYRKYLPEIGKKINPKAYEQSDESKRRDGR